MKRTFFAISISLLCCLIAGCKPSVDISAQEVFARGIAEFHVRYNAQKFGEVYDSSLTYYRSRYTRASSRETLAQIFAENGKVVRTEVKDVRATPGSRGMGATGVAVTTFENGVAEETFAFFHATATDQVALFWHECRELAKFTDPSARDNPPPE